MLIDWRSYVFPYFSLTSWLTLTRPLQLADVTRGLMYMHDLGIVHGNLAGVCVRNPHLLLRAVDVESSRIS